MKIRWTIIIILVLSLALALAGGLTMLWRLFLFLAVLLGISYLWLRLLVRQIEGRIEKTPQSCRVGDRFEEEFTVINNGRLPMLLFEAAENTDLPGHDNTVRFSLPSWGSHNWRAGGICRRRGQYRIGAITGRIFDPLGFFYVSRELTDARYISILPATVDLPFFQVLPRREPGLNARKWFAGEPGLNASRVREYASGDSLRHIHWHSTAHKGQLMVKEFDPDLTRAYYFNDVWIILDLHRESEIGTGVETAAEYGITVAASLVKKYLDTDKRVGLMTSGDHSHIFLPETGEKQARIINEALAAVKPAGVVKLNDLITSQEERIEEGSAVIVITPSGFPDMSAALRRLQLRGTVVTVVLLDGASFGGKTAAAETSHALENAGVHTYIIRRGSEISRALDIRYFSSSGQYLGIKR